MAAAFTQSIRIQQGLSGWSPGRASTASTSPRRREMSCCNVRKTKPLDRALAGAAAWIAGLRADQNDNRHDAGLIGY